MIQKARALLAAAAFCLASQPAVAGNIVQNPGFELGSAYWNVDFFMVGNDPLWAHTGPGMARTSCTGLRCVDSKYDLSFWVRSFIGQGQYSVFWDGVLLDDILLAQNGPMSQASFSGLYASANATLLEIHGRNDLHAISFDDFSVVGASRAAVPPPSAPAPEQLTEISEPAGYALVLAGLVLAGLFRRR
jgi:uncharacterized protein (TIGR03382 family)